MQDTMLGDWLTSGAVTVTPTFNIKTKCIFYVSQD
jgi:hypothetical protein